MANKDESVAKKQKVLIVEVKFKLSINGRVTEGGGECWHCRHAGDSRCAARSSGSAHEGRSVNSGVLR